MKRLEYYIIDKEKVDKKEYGYPGYSTIVRAEENENYGEYISRIRHGLYSCDIVDETDEVIVWKVPFEELLGFDYPPSKEWYVVEMKEASE